MKKLFIILCLFLLCPNAIAEEIPDNTTGRIVIPCINIDQPLYTPEINDSKHIQEIIDNENSALFTNWSTAYQILDHLFSSDADQTGEWNMQKVFPGAYAYLYTKNGTFYYECYMTAKTEYDGNEYINNKIVIPSSSLDIMAACCAEDTSHHYIALFKRLREIS